MVSYCPPDGFGTRIKFIHCDTNFLEQVYEKEKEWSRMFEKLVQYNSENPKNVYISIRVPHHRLIEDSKFRSWLDRQYEFWKDYKFGSNDILDTRHRRLASLGGFPSLQSQNWDIMVDQLLDYKKKHGNVKVPPVYHENIKLGKWVSRCKTQYRRFKRTNRKEGNLERMISLENIGLVDEIMKGEDSWDDMFDRLIDFKKKYGHTKVPYRYEEIPKLGHWVSQCRSNYRKFINSKIAFKKVNPERMKRLKSVKGLVDDIKDDGQTRCIASYM
jgi:hypothetical protein